MPHYKSPPQMKLNKAKEEIEENDLSAKQIYK